jgi:hypothetical protein
LSLSAPSPPLNHPEEPSGDVGPSNQAPVVSGIGQSSDNGIPSKLATQRKAMKPSNLPTIQEASGNPKVQGPSANVTGKAPPLKPSLTIDLEEESMQDDTIDLYETGSEFNPEDLAYQEAVEIGPRDLPSPHSSASITPPPSPPKVVSKKLAAGTRKGKKPTTKPLRIGKGRIVDVGRE